MNKQKIKKEWAVYGDKLGYYDIGKIVEEKISSVFINSTTNQVYPPRLWDLRYVKRFDNPSNAIIFLLQNQGILPIHNQRNLIKKVASNFPEISIREKKIQRIMNAYKN